MCIYIAFGRKQGIATTGDACVVTSVSRLVKQDDLVRVTADVKHCIEAGVCLLYICAPACNIQHTIIKTILQCLLLVLYT